MLTMVKPVVGWILAIVAIMTSCTGNSNSKNTGASCFFVDASSLTDTIISTYSNITSNNSALTTISASNDTSNDTTSVSLDIIKDRLISSSWLLQNGTEFDDVNSYQSSALVRTSQIVGIERMDVSKVVQYYALFCIFEATNARPNFLTDQDPRFMALSEFPGWLFHDGWTSTDVDPCGRNSTMVTSDDTSPSTTEGFYGVTCDIDGKVTHLDLSDNLLTGSFPPEVVLLAGPTIGAGNLQVIDVYKNEFLTNNNDTSWLTRLGPQFDTFMVQGTGFGGHIPKLPSGIINFNIAETLYTGGFVDDNFVDATRLEYLDMDNNNFQLSTVPKVLGSLPNLKYFYCSDCFLSGTLDFMDGMTSIMELWIDANPNITGAIPDFVGNVTTLESFSVAYNSLTGYMPTSLGGLTNLKQFWAYANQLNGEIPSTLGQLTQLVILQLEGNAFVGSMPESVCNNTVFPTDSLKTVGADCNDILFICPCCTCCDLESCLLPDQDASESAPAVEVTTSRTSDSATDCGTDGGRTRRLRGAILHSNLHFHNNVTSVR